MFIVPSVSNMIRRDVFWAQTIPTVIVFVVLIVFTIIGWQSTRNAYEAQRQSVILERVSLIEDAISKRMQATDTLLRAGTGLLDGSESVSRDEWSRFYQKFNVAETYRGVKSVGYAPIVASDELSDFERLLRRDMGPGYSVRASGDQPTHVPVLYGEQFTDRAVDPIGIDLYADSKLSEVMDVAAATDTIRMSSIVSFGDNSEPSVLLFKAVYTRDAPLETVAQREAAQRGYVLAVLHANELFSDLHLESDTDFTFTVSTIADETPRQIFTGGAMPMGAEQVEQSRSELYGQSWNITYYASGDIVSLAESARPTTILVTGLMLTLVVSMAVYLLIKYRTRMFALAEEQKLQEAKDELLSLASHQLRTPATGVKQYIGMVIDGFAGPVRKEQVKLLEQAYKSNERQLQIINEFLYVAKLGSGSLTTTRHVFDLAPLVRDVVDEMRIEIKENNHKIQVKAPKTLQVKADEHSIRMIIENLLSNAIKYTQPGGRIVVEVEHSLREARVSITDSGVGIARRDHKLLFRQFSRISNELSREVNGSGIGLYLAQQLAQRNGGTITVESDAGKGSTFTLHLPIKIVKKITQIRH